MKYLILASLLTGTAGFAQAQDRSTIMDHSPANHSATMGTGPAGAPVSEPGQGAFAAIAEIVELLQSDSQTDWSIVNISGLREHLRDMNVVTIDAVAVSMDVPGGVQLTVTGAKDVAPSIRRMTLAHAAIMAGANDWQYAAEEIDGGAVITVIVPDRDLAKINALGFFGMMASGVHHQAHHWKMATGTDPHG